jgi:hypothetical protein
MGKALKAAVEGLQAAVALGDVAAIAAALPAVLDQQQQVGRRASAARGSLQPAVAPPRRTPCPFWHACFHRSAASKSLGTAPLATQGWGGANPPCPPSPACLHPTSP